MSNTRNVNNIDYHDKAVCIENLTVKYGETLAIAGVSLNVEDGDYLGIIGPNGGGKTTLLKAIIGLVPPASGEIVIYGKKTGKTRRLLGYVPQVTALDKSFPITVHEVVLTGMLNPSFTLFHKYTQSDMEKGDELLERVGIYNLRGRMISELSGGEFQKMLIARALAVDPKLLLLDEPTASVDANSREQIFSLLNELNKSMTIILVTHDLLAVSSYVKTLACLNGKLVYHGEAELNEDVVNALYGCPIDLIAHGVPHRVLKKHKEDE
ncbi:metal ABC transporter ATP-binding protein [Sporanaerobacter acetigenes]|uniref:Zinc transport system ATP-binding protein n=1 Tax=Sporanaerobacter acetigenes DSM 13106 TaxID=1123281 RepID=A0A1M5Z6K9_9FIRM|nr:ABC transporter ATP-binding protein [Sporanaerobacter acetigenes]SHI19886.1 zinc transport system ATP-binding protein [Sporanaerobacter acetigenes DSM 13106]